MGISLLHCISGFYSLEIDFEYIYTLVVCGLIPWLSALLLQVQIRVLTTLGFYRGDAVSAVTNNVDMKWLP